MNKPQIIRTNKPLPFVDLSPLEFERLCLWLVEREGYMRPEHLGESGNEQGRDIIAYKLTNGCEYLWYFQCKRYQKIGAATMIAEVDKYTKLADIDPAKKPAGIVFVTSASLTARSRERIRKHCEQFGYATIFWARNELDMLVKKHPEIVEEFFFATAPAVSSLRQPVPLLSDSMLPEQLVTDEISFRVNLIKSRYTGLFVGRDKELENLDRFIHDNSSGSLVVTAPAGFGKSSLLANWIEQRNRSHYFFVYHFFSSHDETARRLTNCLYNLLKQLYLYYDLNYASLPLDEDKLKLLIASLTRQRKARSKEPLVILIDGLDEADKEFPSFFSSPLPEGVFVVVSWREGQDANSIDLQVWKDNADILRIAPLSTSDIGSWLRYSGDAALAILSNDDVFLGQLEEKAQGFPLYLRYLIDDLAESVKRGDDPRKALDQTPIGIGEYVQREVYTLNIPDKRGIELLFALLSVALGALSRSELQKLTGLSIHDFNRLPHRIKRWFNIVGRNNTAVYSFQHSLLAEEFNKALAEDAQEARRLLLNYCEGWRENQSRYALLHYPAHLQKEKQWQTLFALAQDLEYQEAQSEAFPEIPDLPLRTIQIALMAAGDKDDARAMAEFLLAHAQQIQDIMRESPLNTLRKGLLERAWGLASQHDPDSSLLHHLLLSWELKDKGRMHEAQATIERLQEENLPHLSGWREKLAADLLYQTSSINKNVHTLLRNNILGDEGYEQLCSHLIANNRPDEAEDVAERILDPHNRVRVLCEVLTAMASAGQTEYACRAFDRALKCAALIGETDNTSAFDYKPNPYELIFAAMEKAGLYGYALESPELSDEMEDVEQRFEMAIYLAKAGDCDRALNVVNLLTANNERALALSEIVCALVKAGSIGLAQTTLDQALEHAKQITDSATQAATWLSMAATIAQAGLTEVADTVFRHGLNASVMHQVQYQDKSLCNIIVKMAAAKLFDQSLEACKLLDNSESRNIGSTLQKIVSLMAQERLFDRALETTKLIRISWDKDAALSDIAASMAEAGLFDRALDIANSIGQEERVKVWGNIAAAMIRDGMTEKACILINRAIETVDLIRLSSSKDSALRIIAIALAEAQLFDKALLTAGQIDRSFDQRSTLRMIGNVIAQSGQPQVVQFTITKILDPSWLSENVEYQCAALHSIALGMAEAGQAEHARNIADYILKHSESNNDTSYDVEPLLSTVAVLAQGQSFDKALEIAAQFNDLESKYLALSSIASGLANANRVEQAREILNSLPEARTLSDNPFYQANILPTIAAVTGQIGLTEQACDMFDCAVGAVFTLWNEEYRLYTMATDEKYHDKTMSKIVRAMAETRLFDRALAASKLIRDGEIRALATRLVVAEMVRIGKLEDLQIWLDCTLEDANLITDAEDKTRTLLALAAAMADAEYAERSSDTFDLAYESSALIANKDVRNIILHSIAVVMAEADLFDGALKVAADIDVGWRRADAQEVLVNRMARAKLLDRAIDTVGLIEVAYNESRAWGDIAIEMVQAGLTEKARIALGRAFESASQIHSSGYKSEALLYIATALVRKCSFTLAYEALAKALDHANKIEDEYTRSTSRTWIACSMAEAGMTELAIRVARIILSRRNENLLKIAESFVASKNKEGFIKLLVPCANYLDSAYNICGLLARFYPEQAFAVAEAVLNQTA